MSGFVPWLRIVLSCMVWFAWVAPAFAHTVVLLQASERAPATTELLERLRGELLSIGFEVVVRARPESARASVSESWLSELAAEAHSDAVVDLGGDPTPAAVDVWIIDSAHECELLARIRVEENAASYSKGLAIRVSEVLRARLFEPRAGSDQQRSSGSLPSRSSHNVKVAPQESQPAGRVGFELGAAALSSLEGVGPALLPLVRFGWALDSKLVLQATLAGFGTRPSIEAGAGSAQVGMQYALLGACYRLDFHRRVRPLAALSLGALHTAVDGQAAPPWQGHFVDQWSLLFDASLGAAFQLSQRYTVVLAGHAQLAEPYVAIHFGDQRVASSGRPNLLVSLTLGAWP